MKQKCWDNRVSIDNLNLFVYAFLFLCIPIKWIFAAFVSGSIHELCHVIAIKLCGKKITGLNIGILGAEIQAEAVSGWQEIICLAAGPVGSFFLLLFFRWIPITAFCGMVQGFYNLLPIIPLDGGRILKCICCLVWNEKIALRIIVVIGWACLFVLFGCALFLCFSLKLGIWWLLILIILAINMLSRKIPCKLPQLGVQ